MDLYRILQTLDQLEEDTMASAEKNKTGPKFTDYWKGTDSDVPGDKMVGGIEEDTIEEELRAAWSNYLEEYVATANIADTTTEKAAQAKEIQTAQQNINKLKSAGVSIPVGSAQATQSAVKSTNDPKSVPTAQDKQLSMSLGSEIEQLLTKGDPGQISQLANVIKQVKQGIK